MKVLIAFLSVLFLSCSGSPPVIHNLEWMFVYTRDNARDGVYEEINLFAQLDDEDGIEDVLEFNVYNDDWGWSWKLNPESWVILTENNENWIGGNGLTRGDEIPEGDYRLVIADRSAQKMERIFYLDHPGIDRNSLVFPGATVTDGVIKLENGEREPVVIWFYDDKNNFMKESPARSGEHALNKLLTREEEKIARYFMIYHQDEQAGYGLKSGPFVIPPEGKE